MTTPKLTPLLSGTLPATAPLENAQRSMKPLTLFVEVDGGEHETIIDADMQITLVLRDTIRGKEYPVIKLTMTHNQEYPTPVVTAVAPHPGIRCDIYDWQGQPAWTNKPRPGFDELEAMGFDMETGE